jgi:hypothetical protein
LPISLKHASGAHGYKMTDDYTAADAEADWELEQLYRRFGVIVMEKAIKRRRAGSRSRGRPRLLYRSTEPDAPYLLEMVSLAKQKSDIQPYRLAKEVAGKNQLKGDLNTHIQRLGNKFKTMQGLAKERVIAAGFAECLVLRLRVVEQRERWKEFAGTPEGAQVLAGLDEIEREIDGNLRAWSLL